MSEHLLFLTGSLAEKQLNRVLAEIGAEEFTWRVRSLGLKVAALMTTDMVRRRLQDTDGADRIILPGRCRGDTESLSRELGVPVERGPEELIDLPRYFGRAARQPDLSEHRVRIFAEIVDAPRLDVAAVLQRAAAHRADGADVIDLGCLPETPFPHLADCVIALKQAGHRVSVDSMQSEDLLTGGRAGADFLLSLHEDSLWIADEVAATPVLIPREPGDLVSLERAMAALDARGRAYLADPILDPIHFGFTESLLRYRELRARHPRAPMMMGLGNLTELTEADTTGMTALLMGIVSELEIGNILTTQVSPHCRSVIRETDRARRIMHWARDNNSLPKQIDAGLTALHELRPHALNRDEIDELAAQIRDPSYRIHTSPEGLHIFNRDGLHTATDPFDLFPHLVLDGDTGHAFYLGVELARAEIAWQLGKRYTQDQPLGWGCAVAPRAKADDTQYQAPGSTLQRREHKA